MQEESLKSCKIYDNAAKSSKSMYEGFQQVGLESYVLHPN